MSSTYAGIRSRVSHLQSAKVVGATGNAVSPIVLQTSAPHGLLTGYEVLVVGVLGNTAAQNSPNTPWVITVVDDTHISLDGSTGNGAYTSGGYVFAVNLTPGGTLPDDGDDFDAASVNVELELLADQAAFLMRAIGVVGYQPGIVAPSTGILINRYQIESGVGAGWASWSAATPGSAGWGKVNGFPSPLYNLSPPPLANHGDFFFASMAIGQAACVTNRGRFALGANFLQANMGAGSSAYAPIGAAAMVQAGATHPLALQGACGVNMQGIAASISGFSAGVMTVSGVTNIASGGVGTLVVSGCATPGNNGRFPIVSASGTSCTVKAPGGSATDANNGAIRWHVEDTQFDFDLEVFGVLGSQPAYTLTGDYSLVIHHYRPPAILQF